MSTSTCYQEHMIVMFIMVIIIVTVTISMRTSTIPRVEIFLSVCIIEQ
jgi:hypothetical protein